MANPITMNYDGLISGTEPAPFVAAGKIRKLGTAATYARGTKGAGSVPEIRPS